MAACIGHAAKKVLFIVALATKKNNFFEALKKFPQKKGATKLEGGGGHSGQAIKKTFCGFPNKK